MKKMNNLASQSQATSNNTTKLYHIVLKEGVDKNLYFNKVTSVVKPLNDQPETFKALCTKEQAKTLWGDPQVKCAVDTDKVTDSVSELVTKQVVVKRLSKEHVGEPPVVDGGWDYAGNWGLIRHSSRTNNITTNNVKSTETFSSNYDGTGVDLILLGRSQLTADDTEFMKADGSSRLQQFQWNSLDGLSDLPAIDYTFVENNIHTHSEFVLYCAAGNTYGWATGANVYVWPTETMNAGGINTWDSFGHIQKFHETKIAAGNTRPTVLVCSLGMKNDLDQEDGLMQGLVLRDKVYTNISPSGSGDAHVSSVNKNTNGSFPRMASHVIGYYANEDEKPELFAAIDSKDHAAVKAILDDPSENPYHVLGAGKCQAMMDAGVHYVKAAGNSSESVVNLGHPDYNNCHIGMWTDTNEYFADRRYIASNSRPDGLLGCPDSINVGALSSDMMHNEGQEKLAGFSVRGVGIDCVAVGEDLMLTSHSRSAVYADSPSLDGGPYLVLTSGTSFASPQIAGMACLVLEKYPTTTPKQMKRYFRYIAVGTDKLLDAYPTDLAESTKYGDAPYYSSAGLHGYSGNIAYLDPTLDFDPTSLEDTSINYPTVTVTDTSLNHTVAQVNTKLSGI